MLLKAANYLYISSAPTLSTFKNMLKIHLSRVFTSLTNCFTEYKQQTLYGALVVTQAMLLRLINCRFIILSFYTLINSIGINRAMKLERNCRRASAALDVQ